MSLVRLLTTGKSLVGMQDNLSRYRLTKHRLLPKFGSKKNPFAPPIKAEPTKPAANEAPLAVAEPVPSAPTQAETASCFENQTGGSAAAANFQSLESISVQPAKTGTQADGDT